jgi:hypothetical protein
MKDVVIFATFGNPSSHNGQKSLPNQGLGRKIARDLSRFTGLANSVGAARNRPEKRS